MNINSSNERKWFHKKKKKARNRQYLTKTITDENYTDDLVLLANTPNQIEFILHNLEQAAKGIGLHVNPDKIEFMCFNQDDNISSLNGKPLKLVDKITYLGSNISSTESNVNIHIAKGLPAIDW